MIHTCMFVGGRALSMVQKVSPRFLGSVGDVAVQLLLHFNTVYAAVRTVQHFPTSRLMARPSTFSLSGGAASTMQQMSGVIARFTQSAPLVFQASWPFVNLRRVALLQRALCLKNDSAMRARRSKKVF